MNDPTKTRFRRSRAGLGILALLAASLPAVFASSASYAAGSPLITEPFTAATVADPAWVALDAACLTAATDSPAGGSTLGDCASMQGSPSIGQTPGFFQFTDTGDFEVGGVLYNKPLPGTGGIVAEFEQWQYGGEGADGIGFFLTDGSQNLTEAGGNGGSLGYARINDEPGVKGGYLGVGLDAFGNFTNPTEQRDEGCPATGPGVVPDAVSIRGPGNGTTGYCWLAGSVAPGTTTSTLPGSLRGTGPDDASARTVRITVSADALPLVTVDIDFRTGAGFQQALSHQMTQEAPSTYKLGFLGSTGGQTDVHLIRNLTVSSVQPLGNLSLVKQINNVTEQPESYGVGDSIPYSFVVSNTSTLAPLSAVTVLDAGVASVVCPRTDLGVAGTPTATMECTGSHVVTSDDAALDTYTNIAYATAIDGVNEVRSADSSVSAPLQALASTLALEHTATLADTNSNGFADLGETIAYGYVVTNTGLTTVSEVTIVDTPTDGLTPASVVSLAPAATAAFSSESRVVTQADIDAGLPLTTTATATGTAPGGAAVSSPQASATVLPIPASSELDLADSFVLGDTNANGLADVGETITYTFTVTNVGTTTVHSISVNDGRSPAITPANVDTLAPGDQTVYTGGAYVVTQADIDAGTSILNPSTALGLAPDDTPVRSGEEISTTPTAAADSAISIDVWDVLLDTNLNGVADSGESIEYSYTATNRGTTTLTGVTLTGERVLGLSPAIVATLAPGESVTFTSTTYVVNQGDVDAQAPITVTAAATGTTTGTPPVTISSAPDSATTSVRPASGDLVLTTTATLDDTNTNGVADAGESVTYTYSVTNNRTVSAWRTTIEGNRTTGLTPVPMDLAPGVTQEYTTTVYVVQQSDIDAGTLTSSAVAAGQNLDESRVASTESTTTLEVAAAVGAMGLTSTPTLGDINGNGVADEGETITYEFVVTNTGTSTLTGLTVTSDREVTLTPATADGVPPGATSTFTGQYVVTQGDVDAGGELSVTSTATATAAGGVPVSSAAATATMGLVPAVPSLDLTTTSSIGDTNLNRIADVGETITYSFSVLNDGTTAAYDVTIDATGVTGLTPAPTGISAGDTAVFQATRVVTEGDTETGEGIELTATATGVTADGEPVVSSEFAVITPTAVVPSATPTPDSRDDSGDLPTSGVSPFPIGALAGLILILGAIFVGVRRGASTKLDE
jgi:uncharacterized repeat protein (TIGR01451 family)